MAVKDLHLVAALKVDARVAASLSPGVGQVGHAELDVEPKGAGKGLPGHDVAAARLDEAALQEMPPGRTFAVAMNPAAQALSVKEDDGAPGRGHACDVGLVEPTLDGPGDLLGPAADLDVGITRGRLAQCLQGRHADPDEGCRRGLPADEPLVTQLPEESLDLGAVGRGGLGCRLRQRRQQE